MKWFEETLHKHFRQQFQVSSVVHQGRTKYQDVLIFENPTCGRVLVLDGCVQTTERDEFVYHEMMAHVPLFAHGRARNVLIVGGGDGGVLEEVLKHPVERTVMVEIDGEVVELCRRHLPAICGRAFEDPRTTLIVGDGARHVAETDERYDVVMVDTTDPLGPSEVLFREEFYRNCRRAMTPEGIIVTMAGTPFVESNTLVRTYQGLKPVFADAGCYVAAPPCYNGGLLCYGWGSPSEHARRVGRDELERRVRDAGIETRYYSPGVHVGAFELPGYIAVNLD